jgi:hypothetical protein
LPASLQLPQHSSPQSIPQWLIQTKEAEDALFEEFKTLQEKNGWSMEEMAERFDEEATAPGWNI